MALNIAGVVALVVFYFIILVVGVVAARKKGRRGRASLESSIVADRSVSATVGIFTMTATAVGGGYINGTAESIARDGLAWTIAPLGIFIGLIIGGLVYARPMRDKSYMTMLDPFYERFGSVMVVLVYMASLCGDLFWTASILSALGTTLSVIVDLPLTVAIVTSAGVTVLYTMIGQMISVAYTDIVQLLFIVGGLVLSVPFVLTNGKVGSIDIHKANWLGEVDYKLIPQWIDLLIAMTFGTIPWQSYFQRVLSVKTSRQAQILSVVAGFGAFVLVVPAVLVGAAGKAADWNGTSLGSSPVDIDRASMILPYVLHEFTPTAVSVIGLGAVCAAVMSSMDSSVLGSSSMFTCNIYRNIFRNKSSDRELMWIQRLAILVIGCLATSISIYVPVIYGLFILAADIVFVIVLPQLTCALFFTFSNTYGSICGFLVGLILRLGAGEGSFNFQPFIKYPFYDEIFGQLFPYRTFAMGLSFTTILLVSFLMNVLFGKKVLPQNCDILGVCDRQNLWYNIPTESMSIETSKTEVVGSDQSMCSNGKGSGDHNLEQTYEKEVRM